MKIFSQLKKKREREGGGNGRTNPGEKAGIRISLRAPFHLALPSFISFSKRFRFSFSFSLSLSLSLSLHERNCTAQGVFKSGNIRLSRTFEIEHNGATDTLSLSFSLSLCFLLTPPRGRHRYKTAFASLSNSRSYSPFSLSLSLLILYMPSFIFLCLHVARVRVHYSLAHRYPVYGSRISTRAD